MNFKKQLKKYLIVLYSMLRKEFGPKILYYHDLSKKNTTQGTTFELFCQHINILKQEGFKIVPGIPRNDKEVSICFDDGWRGLWDHREYMIENEIFPTVFLIVDCIGKEGYLTLEEILWLQNKGFRFQGHTYSHKNVTDLAGYELYHELIEARVELSRLLETEVREFCFPRGEYSDAAIEYCLSGGYERLYTSTPAKLTSDSPVLPRLLVQESNPTEFRASIYGGQNFLTRHAEKLHHKI